MKTWGKERKQSKVRKKEGTNVSKRKKKINVQMKKENVSSE